MFFNRETFGLNNQILSTTKSGKFQAKSQMAFFKHDPALTRKKHVYKKNVLHTISF